MLYMEIIAVCSQIHTKHITWIIKTQSVPRSKHSVSVIQTSHLMLYREIIAVCSQIHTKHINTVCGQNGELTLSSVRQKKPYIQSHQVQGWNSPLNGVAASASDEVIYRSSCLVGDILIGQLVIWDSTGGWQRSVLHYKGFVHETAKEQW